ncbi:MAG: tetratricopeptide repeat protein [Bacteroidetes bacterium]|nr:tetratricopeptide repeat protein [Bacteroidota bacterium]
MKQGQFVLVIVAVALIAEGCTVTRTVRSQKLNQEFFSPIRVRQHLQKPHHNSSQIQEAELARIRDSLSAATQMIKYLENRLNNLEMQQTFLAAKHGSLEKQLEYAQAENRKLSQELSDLRARTFASNVPSHDFKLAIPARHTADLTIAYEGALELFMQRQYERSLDSFEYLLNAGIPEDLADNCVYWIGENYFAQRKYSNAIQAFEKVLTIPTSNKHADAYFMLGRTFEILGDVKKARWAYEQVSLRFPNHERASLARQKVRQLQQRIQVPQKKDSSSQTQSI